MISMLLNLTVFNQVVATAKRNCHDHPPMLGAIDRASYEIKYSYYWAYEAQTNVLKLQSTTSNKLYVVDDAHQCEAKAKGHKFCKHTVARRLLQCYADAVGCTPLSAAQPASQSHAAAVTSKPVWKATSFATPRLQVYGFIVHAETDGKTLTFTITNNDKRWVDESPLDQFRYTRDYGQGVLNAMGLRSLYDRLLIGKLLEAGHHAQDLALAYAPQPSITTVSPVARPITHNLAAGLNIVRRTDLGQLNGDYCGSIMI